MSALFWSALTSLFGACVCVFGVVSHVGVLLVFRRSCWGFVKSSLVFPELFLVGVPASSKERIALCVFRVVILACVFLERETKGVFSVSIENKLFA